MIINLAKGLRSIRQVLKLNFVRGAGKEVVIG
jgi:hypothetical protein